VCSSDLGRMTTIKIATLVTDMTMDNRDFRRKLAESQSDANRVANRMGMVVESQTRGYRKLAGSIGASVGMVAGVVGTATVLVGVVGGLAVLAERVATAGERSAEATRKELATRREMARTIADFSRRGDAGLGVRSSFDDRRAAVSREALGIIKSATGSQEQELRILQLRRDNVDRKSRIDRIIAGSRYEKSTLPGRQIRMHESHISANDNEISRILNPLISAIRKARDGNLARINRDESAARRSVSLGLDAELAELRGDPHLAAMYRLTISSEKRSADIINTFGAEGAVLHRPRLLEIETAGRAKLDSEDRDRIEQARLDADARRFGRREFFGGLEAERLRSIRRVGAAGAKERGLNTDRRIFEINRDPTLSPDERVRAAEQVRTNAKNNADFARREAATAKDLRRSNAGIFLAERTAEGLRPGSGGRREIDLLVARHRQLQAILGLGIEDPGRLALVLAASESGLDRRFRAADPTTVTGEGAFGTFGGAGLASRIVGLGPESMEARIGEISSGVSGVIAELKQSNALLLRQAKAVESANSLVAIRPLVPGGVGSGGEIGRAHV